MSNVTNIILTFSAVEDERGVIKLINSYLENEWDENKGRGLVSIHNERLPLGWYGGSKSFEVPLYIGAFNYLNLDALWDCIRGIKWKDFLSVQLLYKREEDNEFYVRRGY